MEWVARGIGAFYIFAGLVAIQAGRSELSMLRAQTNPTGWPMATVKMRSGFVLAIGILTLAGGAALLLLNPLAVWLFLLSTAIQAGFILWIRAAMPARDEVEKRGYQATIQAFVVYLAAFLLTVWVSREGLLS